MTNPPLPEWLLDQLHEESKQKFPISRRAGKFLNDRHAVDRQYYMEATIPYASLWQDAERRFTTLKDALERIANELEQRQAGAFYGMSPNQQKKIYEIAREALAQFPEGGKGGKDA